MPEGQKVYLDDQGNELTAGGVYLDEQGEPVGAATPPPAAATRDMLPPSVPQEDEIDALRRHLGRPWMAEPGIAEQQRQYAREHPLQTVGLLALPGILGGAAKYGGPLIKSAAQGTIRALQNPVVGGTLGAVEGYRQGGATGAVIGGVTGAAGSTQVGNVLKRLGLRAPAAAPAVPAKAPPSVVEGMSTAGRGRYGNLAASDHMISGMSQSARTTGQGVGRVRPRAQPAATAQDALRQELAARNIDWRTTDAVPIDAITRDISRPGGSILEAGESRIGLGERLAEALGRAEKAKTPAAAEAALTEARRLAKAARQRMHIAEKQAR